MRSVVRILRILMIEVFREEGLQVKVQLGSCR